MGVASGDSGRAARPGCAEEVNGAEAGELVVSSREMSARLIKLIRGFVALPLPPDHSRPAQSCGSRGLVLQASHWPGSKSLSRPSQCSELFGHCGVR